MNRLIVAPTPSEQVDFTGERFVPGVGGEIEHEHLHRYFLTLELCREKDVLDVASGEGYGTALLGTVARTAKGLEIDPASVEHARGSYQRPNIEFLQGDCARMPFPDSAFDVVVSFETLEHVEAQATFLAEVKRVLRPGGSLLLSSPVRGIYSPGEANPFHVHELSPDELSAMLSPHFRNVVSLRQVAVVGSVIVPDIAGSEGPREIASVGFFSRQVDGSFVVRDDPGDTPYLLVFASDGPPPPPRVSVLIDRPYMDRTLGGLEDANRRARALADECERRHSLFQSSEERLRTVTAEATETARTLQTKELELASARVELEAGTEALRKSMEVVESLEHEVEEYRAELQRASRWAVDRPLRAVAALAQRRFSRKASGL
jgi:SAM-dependent methyltransferase